SRKRRSSHRVQRPSTEIPHRTRRGRKSARREPHQGFPSPRRTSGKRLPPRPATAPARPGKIHGRSLPAKQGQGSRRDTNELHASSAQVQLIYLRTLQRVDFTSL